MAHTPGYRTIKAALLAAWILCSIVATSAAGFAADRPQAAFGPAQWPQYRGTATRNAVFPAGTQATPAIAPVFDTGGAISATPVIWGGRLYVGNMTGPLSGTLYAFNLTTGQPEWQTKLPNLTMSDVVAVGGTLYVGFGNRDFASRTVRGTGASGVMAVSPDTGEIIWTFKTAGEVMPTPVVNHGLVYIATGDGGLYALDARSGTLEWRLGLPGWDSMASPALDHQTLYVGSSYSLAAISVPRRAITWMFRDYATFTDVSPAVARDSAGRTLIVTTAVKGADRLTREEKATYTLNSHQAAHFIYAFNQKGLLVWKDLLGQGPSQDDNTSGAPTIADGKVFVGSPYTLAVYAFDLTDGHQLWRADAGAGVKGAPAVADGKVYAGDVKGRLHVFDEATGREIASVQLGHKALAPAGPVIVGDILFMASQDGRVYARSLDQLGIAQ